MRFGRGQGTQGMTARRSALARLSDNPFCAEDSLLSSFRQQPSAKEGQGSPYKNGAQRANGAASQPTSAPQRRGKPEMIPTGYGYDEQVRGTSQDRNSRSKTSWAGELGGASDSTPSATPTRPPAALGDAQGWLRVQSVSAARQESERENEFFGSMNSAANKSAELHLLQRQGDGAQASTGSPILETRRPTSRPLTKNGGSLKQSIESKDTSGAIHHMTSLGRESNGTNAASMASAAPSTPLQPDLPPTSSPQKQKHLVEVEDMVRNTVQSLASGLGKEGNTATPTAQPSRFATAAFQRVLLPEEPPRVDFDSVIAILTPTKALPAFPERKNNDHSANRISTPKSTEARGQACADDTELEASAVGDTLCTLSIDSNGASFALSRASPRPGLPSTHSSSRPGLQHADVNASVFGLAPTPLASHARANGEKTADKTGQDASSATTVDDSSTDIEDEDDTAPLISPWTGRKAPLDWSFIPKGGSPVLDELSFCGPRARGCADMTCAMDRGLEAEMVGSIECMDELRQLAEAERELREEYARLLSHSGDTSASATPTWDMIAAAVFDRNRQGQAPVSMIKNGVIEADGGKDLVPHLPMRVIVFGGCDDVALGGMVAGCEEMRLTHDARGGEWSMLEGVDLNRGAASAVCINGMCYLVGGFDGSKVLQDASVHMMNTQGGKARVETLPGKMSVPRLSCGAVALGTRLLVMGGTDGRHVHNSVDCFDTSTKEWVSMTNRSLNVARAACGVVSVGGRAYAVGGYGKSGAPLATAEVYDEEKGRWELLPGSMSDARMDCGLCAVGHLLVVVGGRGEGGSVLGSCEVYDLNRGGGWFKAAGRLNVPRAGMGTVSVGGRVLAIAGSDGRGLLSSCEEYDVASDVWRLLPSKLARSRGACSAVLEGSVVFGA